ncbi:MAG: Hsp70 family protein [Alphaproteobacteria bacterium]|nr:Hsp70 family protein [Alphaproteobacteria bacterium]
MMAFLQLLEPGQTPDLHDPSKGVVVGIDLGTTHSVVAVVKDGKPQVLSFEDQGPLVPSILYAAQENLKVGEATGEKLSSTKRLMGRGPQDPICSQFPQLISGEGIRLQLGKHTLTPVEVASHILSHLREQVEKTLTLPLEAAVITVPAYFDEAARVATKQAAALAGIKVLRLMNEPTAAALAYGLQTGVEGIYAIYDFGGGTFDLSLLKLEEGIFQVLGTGGDLNLGGDDIDHALVEQLNLPSLKKARSLKEYLSDHDNDEGVTRADLESCAMPFVKRTVAITKEVLQTANLSPQDIQGIVLVGGMTRMPLVRREVEAFFGKKPLWDMDPDQAVALGAALSAHGLRHGSETLLLDVTPLSLGLETMGGLVEKLIPRNAPLPALASQEFTTHQDGQGGMVIHVVQGEREFVSDCRSLARFELRGLPPMPAGAARIRIDFAVDAEGLLTVSAIEKTTGLSQHVEVHPSYGLDEKTLADAILESQRYGREDIKRRLKVEEELKKQTFSIESTDD